ncbi:MAG: nucleotidyltransferase domain-containing protein [Gammaproteobacteria bacterium]|nr:nucleotidyltransferase domain-containing protein [Gammaproteobacteria bacterium]
MVTARLSPLEKIVLTTFATRVRERFGPRTVAIDLFGSRARGEGRADSDLDVLVLVLGLTSAERREIQDLAFDLSLDNALVISPLVVDSARWDLSLPLARSISHDRLTL